MPNIFTFAGSDWIFIFLKVVALLFCIPWLLTLPATIMSLAGQTPSSMPLYQVILTRMAWLAAFLYPFILFGLMYFSEKVIAPKSYPLGVALAAIPLIASILIIFSIYSPNKHSDIFAAISDRNLAEVRRLLDAGANIEAKGFNDATPLLEAALGASWNICRFLLERGADPAAVSRDGITFVRPVMTANIVPDSAAGRDWNFAREIIHQRHLEYLNLSPKEVEALMRAGRWPPAK